MAFFCRNFLDILMQHWEQNFACLRISNGIPMYLTDGRTDRCQCLTPHLVGLEGAWREIIAHVNNELGTLWGKLAAIAVKRQSVVVKNEHTVWGRGLRRGLSSRPELQDDSSHTSSRCSQRLIGRQRIVPPKRLVRDSSTVTWYTLHGRTAGSAQNRKNVRPAGTARLRRGGAEGLRAVVVAAANRRSRWRPRRCTTAG